jgi:Protein of unknown function (DUF3551)
MNKYTLTAAAFGMAVAGSFGMTTSPAKAGPVCLTDNDSPQTYRSCNFYSYAACRASSRGAGGSCVANPRGNDDFYGYEVGPSVDYGNAYNRYDGPVYGAPGYGGGYIRVR